MLMYEKVKKMWESAEADFVASGNESRMKHLENLLLVKGGRPNVPLIQARMQKDLDLSDENVMQEYTDFLNVMNRTAEKYLACVAANETEINDLYEFIWGSSMQNDTGVSAAGVDLDFFDFEVKPKGCSVTDLLSTGSYYPIALSSATGCKMYQVLSEAGYKFFADETSLLGWMVDYHAGTSDFLDIVLASITDMINKKTMKFPIAVVQVNASSAEETEFKLKDVFGYPIWCRAQVDLTTKSTPFGEQNVLEVAF